MTKAARALGAHRNRRPRGKDRVRRTITEHCLHGRAARKGVTDQGACFTAGEFQEAVARHGTKARFGALGRHGSIALIERLWLALKDLLRLRLDRRLLRDDLEPRIGLGLFYYSVLKPHQGLAGTTPAEVYFQKEAAGVSAVPPPREINPMPPPAFAIRHLDAPRRLPVLFMKAA